MRRPSDLDDPRRRVLIRALSLGLVGGALAAPAAAQFFGSRPAKLPATRNVYKLRGDVTVNGQPATLETRIKPGDTIKTGKGAELIFAVGGQSMILRDETTLTLEKGANEPEESLIVRGLRLLTGAVLQVSRDTQMRVTTANASIGIRGTGYYVEAAPDLTYFCTCYGLTEVASATDPQSRETIAATQHDRPVYVVSDAPAGRRIRNAPFINHTDQELAIIEELVGRTPPFVFPKETYSGPRREY